MVESDFMVKKEKTQKCAKRFILIQLYPRGGSFCCTSIQIYLFQIDKAEKAENSSNFLICRSFSTVIHITELKPYHKKPHGDLDKLFMGIFMGQL